MHWIGALTYVRLACTPVSRRLPCIGTIGSTSTGWMALPVLTLPVLALPVLGLLVLFVEGSSIGSAAIAGSAIGSAIDSAIDSATPALYCSRSTSAPCFSSSLSPPLAPFPGQPLCQPVHCFATTNQKTRSRNPICLPVVSDLLDSCYLLYHIVT